MNLKLVTSICFVFMASTAFAEPEIDVTKIKKVVKDFQAVLLAHTNNDTEKYDKIIAKMRKEKNFLKIHEAAGDDEEKLKSHINEYIIVMEKQLYPVTTNEPENLTRTVENLTLPSDAFLKLSESLRNFLPFHMKFNIKFVEFLRSQNISDEEHLARINNIKPIQLKTVTEFIEFVANHPNEVNESVKASIINILKFSKNYDEQDKSALLRHLHQSEIVFTVDELLNIKEMEARIDQLMKQIQRDEAFNRLKESLTEWYRELETLNNDLLIFLKEKKLENKVISELSQNRTAFQQFLLNYDDTFSAAHKKSLSEEVSVLISEFVSDDDRIKQNQKFIAIALLANETAVKESGKLVYVYDKEKLSEHIQPLINKVINDLESRDARQKIKNQLIKWFAHTEDFADDFMDFLAKQNAPLEALLDMSESKSTMFSEKNNYLHNFILLNKNTFNKLIYREIEIILRDFNQTTATENLNKLRANNFEKNFKKKQHLLVDSSIFKNVVMTKLSEILTEEAMKNIEGQLNSWFRGSTSFVRSYSDFLRTQNLTVETLRVLPNSKEIMFSQDKTNVNEFVFHNKELFNDLIYKEVKNKLQTENAKTAEENLKTLKNHNFESLFLPKFLFDSLTLKTLTESKLIELWTNEAYESIEEKLRVWYNNSNVFITAYINYLKSGNLSLETLRSLTKNRKDMYAEDKVKFSDFIKRNKEIFNDFMYQQIYKILVKLHHPRESEMLGKLKTNTFEEKFSYESLINLSEFENLIENELERIIYNECKERIKSRVENLSRVENSKVQQQLRDNKCIAEEICNQRSEFDEIYLKEKLSPYVEALKRTGRKSNVNIKDEFDDTIYDTIQSILTEKTSAETKLSNSEVDCFVAFTYRENKIDGIYSSELLFDGEKLMQQVQPIIKEYLEIYKKKSIQS